MYSLSVRGPGVSRAEHRYPYMCGGIMAGVGGLASAPAAGLLPLKMTCCSLNMIHFVHLPRAIRLCNHFPFPYRLPLSLPASPRVGGPPPECHIPEWAVTCQCVQMSGQPGLGSKQTGVLLPCLVGVRATLPGGGVCLYSATAHRAATQPASPD